MPLSELFDYPSIYNYRDFNEYENRLFRVCRSGSFHQEPIIVSDINQFK